MFNKYALIILLLFIKTATFSQDNAIAAFDLPLNNNFKFNKYLINPTFSFVREDNALISFYNRRQWNGFEGAPQVYFINYSSRMSDNSSAAIGLYQQNYGVFTNFGAQVNYANNVVLSDENNFTFGFNLAYYNSGFNYGKIITNNTEPRLQDFASNSLLAFKPGINFGTAFLDIGITANNLFLYNFKTSQIVANDQAKSFSGHVMYTGYLENSDGLLEKAKFTAILQADKKKDVTGFSGNLMLDIPKAGWINGGYNTIYGISGGLGLLITKRIAVGYSFEKGLGDFSRLGNTHEITFAYLFKNYNDDDYEPLFSKSTPTQTVSSPKPDLDLVKKNAEIATAERARLAQEAAERIKIANEVKTAKIKEAQDAVNAKLIVDAKKIEDNKTLIENKIKVEKERVALEAVNLKATTDAKSVASKQKIANDEAARIKAIADAKTLAEKNNLEKNKVNQEKINQDKAEKQRIAGIELAKLKAKADAKAIADAQLLAEKNKLQADKISAAKIEKQRLAEEEKERAKAIADEKAIADAKAIEEKNRLAVEKIEKDKLEKERVATVLNTAKQKAADEANAIIEKNKIEAQKIAQDKLDKKRIADEQITKLKEIADAKAIADAKLLAEKNKLEADKLATAKIEKQRLAEEEKAKLKAISDEKAIADKEKINKVLLEKAEQLKLKAIADAKAVEEKNRLATEKAEKDKIEKERLANEALIAKQKAIAEAQLLAEKNKAIADEKAIADKEKADQQRLIKEEQARLKAVADAKAIEEKNRLAVEKVEKDKVEKERLANEALIAKQKAIADAQLLAEKNKVEADKLAAAKLEKQRLADEEKARLKAIADEKAIADKEKADQQRLIKEEQARLKAIADAKAVEEKNRLATEKLEKDKLEKERLAIQAQAAKQKAIDDAKAIAEKAKLVANKINQDKIDKDTAANEAAAAKAKAIADAKALTEKNRLALEKSDKDKLDLANANKIDIDRIKAKDAVSTRVLDGFQKELELKSKISNKLISSLDSIVKTRDSELQDYKNEGKTNAVVKEQKKFVSSAETNKALSNIQNDLSDNKTALGRLISDFETKNNERIKAIKASGISDVEAQTLNENYLQVLNGLKAKKLKIEQSERDLNKRVEEIKIERDIEVRNRIKKAQFDTEKVRNEKDQASLTAKINQLGSGIITKPTVPAGVDKPKTITNDNSVSDIQIIKNINNVSSGCYLVLDTFDTVEQRDSFVATALQAGAVNVQSFFNIYKSLYYVYIAKYSTLAEALEAQKVKGTTSYNSKMFIVKVEN